MTPLNNLSFQCAFDAQVDLLEKEFCCSIIPPLLSKKLEEKHVVLMFVFKLGGVEFASNQGVSNFAESLLF